MSLRSKASLISSLASMRKVEGQLEKIGVSSVCREGGSFTYAKLEQLCKVFFLMIARLGGNLKSVRELQSRNARFPIFVKLACFEKSTSVRDEHLINAFLPMDSKYVSSWKFTYDREEQPLKAAVSIVLMDVGSLTDTIVLHRVNSVTDRILSLP